MAWDRMVSRDNPPPARTGHESPRVFRVPLGARVMTSLLAAFLWLTVAATEPTSWYVVLTQAPLAAGLAGGVCFVASSSRLVLRSDGLDVQNLFVQRRVQWHEIVRVQHDGGLRLHLVNRRTVDVAALGGSLFSQLVKNTRQRRVAELIDARLPHAPDVDLQNTSAGAPTASRRAIAFFAAGFAFFYASGIVIHAVRR